MKVKERLASLLNVDPLVEATAAAEKCLAAIETLDARVANIDPEYARAVEEGTSSAIQAIENGTPVSISAQTMQLAAERDVLRRGRPALVEKFDKARREIYRVKASALDHQAAALREESASIIADCQGPLEKLAKLQGVAYDASILQYQRSGSWYKVFSGYKPAEPTDGPGAVALDPTNRELYARPKSVMLFQAATELEEQAAALRAKADAVESVVPPAAVISTGHGIAEVQRGLLAPAPESERSILGAAIESDPLRRQSVPSDLRAMLAAAISAAA